MNGTYQWNNAEETHATSYLKAKVLAALRDIGASRILDIGAGNGALCGALATEGFDTVGVENEKRGVELAQAAHPSIHFYNYAVQDDPKKLLATERLFDTVISTEVIEHLFSPHLLPQYAKAVLSPGGYLIISTPYHGYLKNLALSVLGKWDWHHTALWHGGHIKFWSRATLTKLLSDNGFEVVRFVGAGRVPYLWKSMVLVARIA